MRLQGPEIKEGQRTQTKSGARPHATATPSMAASDAATCEARACVSMTVPWPTVVQPEPVFRLFAYPPLQFVLRLMRKAWANSDFKGTVSISVFGAVRCTLADLALVY
jgi:hypothetical protein